MSAELDSLIRRVDDIRHNAVTWERFQKSAGADEREESLPRSLEETMQQESGSRESEYR